MTDSLATGTSLSVINRVAKLRERIKSRTAELGVETRHTTEAHFYFIPELNEVVGSVSAEHLNIKDPSIRNFEKNESLRYVKANYKLFTEQNIDNYLKAAAEAPILVRDNAGSKGNYIHDCRQVYFQKWIDSNSITKPEGSVEAIAKARDDIPQEFYYE